MKRRTAAVLLLVLLGSISTWAISDNIMLVRMVTNEKRVVILYVDGEINNGTQRHYSLSCNQQQTTCAVPDKGRYYHMETSGQTIYQCPEVTLTEMSDRNKVLGVYCVQDMN